MQSRTTVLLAVLCLASAAVATVVQQGNSFPEGVVVGDGIPANPTPGTLRVSSDGHNLLKLFTDAGQWTDVNTDSDRLTQMEELFNRLSDFEYLQALVFCSGGGQFVAGATNELDSCSCYSSLEDGYYEGNRCESCQSGISRDSEKKCVVDGNAPVVTLNGPSLVWLSEADTYEEFGAIAIDGEYGNITASIVVNSTVQHGVPGEYKVYYTAQDGQGNEGVAVRDVAIIPSEIYSCYEYKVAHPNAFSGTYVMTVDGGTAPVYCEMTIEGGGWTLALSQLTGGYTHLLSRTGVLASLDDDGSHTYVDNIVDGSFETLWTDHALTPFLWAGIPARYAEVLLGGEPQEYVPVTYFKGPMSAIVNVHTVVGSNTNWGHGSRNLDFLNPLYETGRYACWNDFNNEDLPFYGYASGSPSFCEGYDPVYSFPSNTGRGASGFQYHIFFRTVSVPEISVVGDEVVMVWIGGDYVDAGATAVDATDGDLSSQIQVTGYPVNTNVHGSHTITYNVTDSHGNSVTATRTVVVVIRSCWEYKHLYDPSATSGTYLFSATGSLDNTISQYCEMSIEGGGWTLSMAQTSSSNYHRVHEGTIGALPTLGQHGSVNFFEDMMHGAFEILWTDASLQPFLWAQIGNFSDTPHATYADFFLDDFDVYDWVNFDTQYFKGPMSVVGRTKGYISQSIHWGHVVRDIDGLNMYPSGVHVCWNDIQSNHADRPFYGYQASTPAFCQGYDPAYSFPALDSGRQRTDFNYYIFYRHVDAPRLSLNGPSTVYVMLGDDYVPSVSGYGATAYDHQDGNLTDSIVETHFVDTTKAGDHHIVYSVRDSDGNVGRVRRRVVVLIPSCYEYKQANPAAGSGTYRIDINGGDPSDRFETYCEMTIEGGGWMPVLNQVESSYARILDQSLPEITDLNDHGAHAKIYELLPQAFEVLMTDDSLTPFLWARIGNFTDGTPGPYYADVMSNLGGTQHVPVDYFKGPMTGRRYLQLSTGLHWGHVNRNVDLLSGVYPTGVHVCWMDVQTTQRDRPFYGYQQAKPSFCQGYSPTYTFPTGSGRGETDFDYHIFYRTVTS